LTFTRSCKRSAAERRLLIVGVAASLAAAFSLACGPCDREKAGLAKANRANLEDAKRPGSHPEVSERMRIDRESVRNPADGKGSALLVREGGDPEVIRIGEFHRFRFVYEAGPLGIAVGGRLYFQVSPFFGWSKIQTSAEDLAGYTTFSTDAEGVELVADRMENPYLLPIAIRGRALREGERVGFVYGAGERKAQVDRFAERGERFWFHVDGDGDGIREIVTDSPTIDVLPGPVVQCVLTLPATARPGDTVSLVAALLDRSGNAWNPEAATLTFVDPPAGLRLPESVRFEPADLGVRKIEVTVVGEGVQRVKAKVRRAGEGTPLEAESNPMLTGADAPRLLFADLHGHTNWSDGTGVPEDYFRYARDVAALDVVALTDHDHWGTPFLDASADRWKQIEKLTEEFHAPGRFVTVLGFEWTNWTYGHRHVLYFDGPGPVISNVDPNTQAPTQLWDALRGRQALTFAHHSAGGPVATDWSFAPDPVLEPITEVVSAHGSSEAPDSPLPIYNPIAGNWVRDQLVRGYKLGFVGSGDSHDGHPGLTHLAAASGGLAAIWSEPTREGVLAALRAHRSYATNGPRIILRASLAGHRIGETVSAAELAQTASEGRDNLLTVQVIAPAPLARVDVIHGPDVVQQLDAEGRREMLVSWAVPELHAGEFLYVRAVQQDAGVAWSSPWFIE
jgi:hypothetical protein